MTTNGMTRTEWERLVAARADRFGGDFWNQHQIYRRAFGQHLDAVHVAPLSSGTGLWADAVLTFADGQRVERRFYA